MDIKCERCGTEYEFDDSRVSEEGVTVKCSTCGHLFKIRKKSFVLTEPVPQDDGGAADGGKNWMVRRRDGTVLSFKELTTLQKWIVERRVSREDEISKSGETWKRLGGIAELASFFQVVDQAMAATQPLLPAISLPPVPSLPPQSQPVLPAVSYPPPSQPVLPGMQGMVSQGMVSQPMAPAVSYPPQSQPVMPAVQPPPPAVSYPP
ncbi:MAG TPA: zinc-ribbon domain-containing protein, partial [Myxococcota bacterium]|nr:zinc-ribbon domain-containing protein [Myxococcota bacterium]